MPGLTARNYALALHTSSPELGLGLSNFTNDSRCQVWNLGQDLSTQLQLCLADFLPPQTWTDLSWIAVCQGPGGFTGTRLGVVTARTLAQQLQIPLYAISALEAIAHTYQVQLPIGTDLAIEMPAQRGQVFTAIYSTEPSLGLADQVRSPEEWQQVLQHWSRPYERVIAPSHQGQFVTSLLDLADARWQRDDRPDWAAALPFYGQHPVTS